LVEQSKRSGSSLWEVRIISNFCFIEHLGVEELNELNDCASDEFFEFVIERSAKNTQIYHDVFKAEPHSSQTTFEKLIMDRNEQKSMSVEERTRLYEELIPGVVGHVVDYAIDYMSEQSLELDYTDPNNLIPKITFT
jgi:hypothetical protein